MACTTWRVVGNSIRGSSHEKTGLPCQDALHWWIGSNGILIAAVADGAGSAISAEIGAELASRTAVQSLRSAMPDDVGQQTDEAIRDFPWLPSISKAVESARTAVISEANARGVKARDLASTLIVVVGTPHTVIAAQVGDGAAVVADDAGTITALTVPPEGEYLNETVFLTTPGVLDQVQYNAWQGKPRQLAVFSDGLQMLALKIPGGIPHAPFFQPLFRFVADKGGHAAASDELAAFLSSPAVRQRTDDDVSLLLAQLVD